MRNFKENAVDVVSTAVGGSVFCVVSAVTAAVMAVGFVAITAIEIVFHIPRAHA